jgi:hypothetical protein
MPAKKGGDPANRDQAQAALRGDQAVVSDVDHQTVVRLPADIDVGPFFPSGMSAPEAAMAGATAGMPEEQREEIARAAEESGFVTPEALVAGSWDKDDRD